MNWVDIVKELIAVIGIGGLISGLLLRKIDKISKKSEKQSNDIIEQNVKTMRYLMANGELTEAIAISFQQGKSNGEITEALKSHTTYKKELECFLVTAAMSNIGKR